MLVDTNVLIAYIRTADPKLLTLFRTHSAAICGIVRAELLHGARSPKERAQVLTILATLKSIPITEPLWDEVGDNLALLRSQGVTVQLSDVVLATLAISANVELWSRDAHFTHIQRVLPALRLFVEPP